MSQKYILPLSVKRYFSPDEHALYKENFATNGNLVPRAHVPFGQHQDTELWNNQIPEL